MGTIRQIVTDAYREAGIIEIESTLDADKFTEGLRRFNVLFDSLFAHELGEQLTTVNYGQSGLTNTFGKEEDYSSFIDSLYVPANHRLNLRLGAAATLYLDPNPDDGARFAIIDAGGNLATYNVIVDANGRKIESSNTVTLSTNSLNRSWFYRADTGNWVKVVDYIDGDSSPFPDEFDDFLVTLLAIRINPRHGAVTSEETVEALKRSRKQFRARYKQKKEMDSEAGLQKRPFRSRNA